VVFSTIQNCAKGIGLGLGLGIAFHFCIIYVLGLGLGVRVSVSLTFLPLRRPLANDAKVARSNCLRAVPNCLCSRTLSQARPIDFEVS